MVLAMVLGLYYMETVAAISTENWKNRVLAAPHATRGTFAHYYPTQKR